MNFLEPRRWTVEALVMVKARARLEGDKHIDFTKLAPEPWENYDGDRLHFARWNLKKDVILWREGRKQTVVATLREFTWRLNKVTGIDANSYP